MPLIGGAVMPHGALILDPARAEMAGEVEAEVLAAARGAEATKRTTSERLHPTASICTCCSFHT